MGLCRWWISDGVCGFVLVVDVGLFDLVDVWCWMWVCAGDGCGFMPISLDFFFFFF